ncbi:hypothetical protein EEB18_015715 [Sphingopyxis sp. OPL5]|uniref:hypothetical protein n=1 Tax=Sphingopyxis sp. OPL5 TaxID=2486273 RepID=UPI00164CF67C|nr:hypothetical protein [Sphingopyxis sp. OPL5]QNO26213.1 hypothetical protein EEB18_015715 [Sphingopyxis sp. OPL5]
MRTQIAILLFLLVSCTDALGGSSRDEVAWAKSPDGRVHAILLETNGGATTSFGYLIELHPADHQGEKPVNAGSLYGAVRSDCAYGIDLHWNDANTLVLRFDSAKKMDVPASVTVAGKRIRIAVEDGMKNESAPCGGMAANRVAANGS